MKRRLVEIKNDLQRLEKLLKVAMPSTFNLTNWKNELENELKTSLN